MRDDIALLISEEIEVDDIGNETKKLTEKQIYCQARSVTMREFYQAAQAGLRPSVVLTMQGADYSGEKIVTWCNKSYSVLRVYWNTGDFVELSLEERTALNG